MSDPRGAEGRRRSMLRRPVTQEAEMNVSSVGTPTSPPPATVGARPKLQWLATGVSAGIALLYALMFLGILSVEGASGDERGIVGLAAAVFVALTVALWWRRSRLLWAGTAGLQLAMGAMYVAIAPERDPSFEVWGLTVRGLSLVLLAALVGLLVSARRDRMVAP